MSNSIIYLNSNDFFVGEGSKGKVLCTNIKELVFVMFHADSDKCKYCEEAVPQFRQLPHAISSCRFAFVNLNNNLDIVKMANETIAPFSYVPYMILYVNGRPFIRYDGDRNVKDMADFVIEVISRLKSNVNTKFSNAPVKKIKQENEIPPYTIAIPYSVVCDDDAGVCYLKYDEAYKSGKK
jgi:thiol-disulfide isomerase/thioredoxin